MFAEEILTKSYAKMSIDVRLSARAGLAIVWATDYILNVFWVTNLAVEESLKANSRHKFPND